MEPSRTERADAVLAHLVRRGTLTAAQAYAVKESLASVLTQPDEPAQPPPPAERRRGSSGWAEIAGYLGGALVFAAATLFTFENSAELSETQMAAWQGGAAVLLLTAATALAVLTPGGPAALRRRTPDASDAPNARRRLTSTLVTLGAAAAAASASLLVTGGVADVLGPSTPERVTGLLVLAVGVTWAAVAVLGMFREHDTALALGAGTALAGAQATAGSGMEWAYGLTSLLAVLGFALYARLRRWPLLALGIAAVTLAVPEALTELTDSQVGAVGGLLAAGLSLIAASALGLRIRAATTSRRGGQP